MSIDRYPTPWRRGETLLTPQTGHWSTMQWRSNELEERRSIFACFDDDDQGRSRQFVAKCHDAELAQRIVQVMNVHDKLVAALEDLLCYEGLTSPDSDDLEASYRKAREALTEAKGTST